MTTYSFAKQILDYVTGKTQTLPGGGTVYVGLSYTDPTRSGSNISEPAENTGYKRKLLGQYNQSYTQIMGAVTEAETTNDEEIHFPEALITYPQNVTHYLIFVGTTLIMYGPLTSPIKPVANSVPMVRKNELVLTVDK